MSEEQTEGQKMLEYLKQQFKDGKSDQEICFDKKVTLAPTPVLVAAIREAVK